MKSKNIAIIGGGNLGGSVAEGLLKSKFIKPGQLTVTDKNPRQLQSLKSKGVTTTDDNFLAVKKADVVLFALKPYVLKDVVSELKEELNPKRHLIISVAAGIKLKDLTSILNHGVPVFRVMPNTAIAIQESVTCICYSGASSAQIKYVTELFNQLGITISIDEKLMDASTVIGACGIAYALRFIRAATQGGIEIGFDAKTASLIAAQTVKGSAELLLKLNRHAEEEIDKVTTPKGCTIAGLNEMEHQGFSSSLIKGIKASYDKLVHDA